MEEVKITITQDYVEINGYRARPYPRRAKVGNGYIIRSCASCMLLSARKSTGINYCSMVDCFDWGGKKGNKVVFM